LTQKNNAQTLRLFFII